MADHKGITKGKIRIPEDVWEDARKIFRGYQRENPSSDIEEMDGKKNKGLHKNKADEKERVLYPYTFRAAKRVAMLDQFPVGEDEELDAAREFIIKQMLLNTWGISMITNFRINSPFQLQTALAEIDSFDTWNEAVTDITVSLPLRMVDVKGGERGYSVEGVRMIKIGYQPVEKDGEVGGQFLGRGKMTVIKECIAQALGCFNPPNWWDNHNMAVTNFYPAQWDSPTKQHAIEVVSSPMLGWVLFFIWTSPMYAKLKMEVYDLHQPAWPKLQSELSRPGDAVMVVGELIKSKFVFKIEADEEEQLQYRYGTLTMVYYPTVPPCPPVEWETIEVL